MQSIHSSLIAAVCKMARSGIRIASVVLIYPSSSWDRNLQAVGWEWLQ